MIIPSFSGVIFEFLSVPIIKAFSSATAILVIESQIKVMLGVKYLVSGFIGSVATLLPRLPETNVGDLLMGLFAVCFLLGVAVSKRESTRILLFFIYSYSLYSANGNIGG